MRRRKSRHLFYISYRGWGSWAGQYTFYKNFRWGSVFLNCTTSYGWDVRNYIIKYLVMSVCLGCTDDFSLFVFRYGAFLVGSGTLQCASLCDSYENDVTSYLRCQDKHCCVVESWYGGGEAESRHAAKSLDSQYACCACQDCHKIVFVRRIFFVLGSGFSVPGGEGDLRTKETRG